MTVDLSTRDLVCRLAHDAGLRLDQLTLPGNDWVDSAGSPLFDLVADGMHLGARSDGWQTMDVHIEDGLASTDCITRLRHAPTDLEVVHHFIVHAEGLIESWLDVRNAGDRPITLTRLDSLALAQISPDAPAARTHPEWLIHAGDDYFGAAPLCLSHTLCREWLTDEILRLIDEEGVNYIIQDGEDMVKLCWRDDHTHAPGNSNYANAEHGLDRVIAAIRRQRPHVTLENCEDGGCMLTYKMARLYHTSITVDNIATYATRQGIYGASYPFSLRYSVRYMQDDPNRYTLRSAIFGGPLILMQRITDWTPQQVAETRAAIAKYKELRTLTRDAKVIHLIAPRYNVEGRGWSWDAIQAVSPDQMRSVVMIFRAMGGPARRAVRPRGLNAAAAYRVRAEDRGDLGTITGAALMRDGLTLALDEFGSEVIWIESDSANL